MNHGKIIQWVVFYFKFSFSTRWWHNYIFFKICVLKNCYSAGHVFLASYFHICLCPCTLIKPILTMYTLFTLDEEDGYFYVKRRLLREIRHMNSVTVHLNPPGEILASIQNKIMIVKTEIYWIKTTNQVCTLQQGPSEITLEFFLSNYNG